MNVLEFINEKLPGFDFIYNENQIKIKDAYFLKSEENQYSDNNVLSILFDGSDYSLKNKSLFSNLYLSKFKNIYKYYLLRGFKINTFSLNSCVIIMQIEIPEQKEFEFDYYDAVIKAFKLYPHTKILIPERASEFLNAYKKELEENKEFKEWILKQIDKNKEEKKDKNFETIFKAFKEIAELEERKNIK